MTKLPFTKNQKLEKTITVKFSKNDYDKIVSYCKLNKYKMSYLIREIFLDWYNH